MARDTASGRRSIFVVSTIWTIPVGFVWVTTSLISPREKGLAGPKKGKASSLCRGMVPMMLMRSPFVTGLFRSVPFRASSLARSLLPSSAGARTTLVAGLVSAFLTFTYSPRLLPLFCLTSPSILISPVLRSSGGPYITMAPVVLCPFISIMSPELTCSLAMASGSTRTMPLPALRRSISATFNSTSCCGIFYKSSWCYLYSLFVSLIVFCRRFRSPNSSSMKVSRLDMDCVKCVSISWNSLSPWLVRKYMCLSGPRSPWGWWGSLFIHPSSCRRFRRGYMVPGLSSIFPSLIWYVLFEISAPCIDSVFMSASTISSSIPRFISLIQHCSFLWNSSIF